MSEITLTSGLKFISINLLSILESAKKSNINISYSCNNGLCGACKCKVLKGKTDLLKPEIGLNNDEKEEGWILSCVRFAKSDLLIEVEQLVNVDLPIVRIFPCRIDKINRLSYDVLQIFLRFPPKTDFKFFPGQHVSVVGKKNITRSYSIANSDFSEHLIELHIKYVSSGLFSDYWFNYAKINDLLYLIGPKGTFFIRDYNSLNMYFLATGTGIAPIKSIIYSMNSVKDKPHNLNITLAWGVRNLEDFYLDLNNLPSFVNFIPVLSNPKPEWVGSKGHVQDVLLDLNINLKNAVVYACGSNNMVNEAKIKFIKSGLQPNHFYSDAFVST